MLSEHLLDNFLKYFKHKPTDNQLHFFNKFAEFITQYSDNKVFLLTGYAGTGKTTAVGAVIQSLHKLRIKSVLLAPTGRAAKVFGKYSKHAAYTIHKKIYRQLSASDGFGNFTLDRNLHKDTLFMVDEASMISGFTSEGFIFGTGNLLQDLVDYVYSGNNCHLVLIGDNAQLPPVGIDQSPALNSAVLTAMSLDVSEVDLSTIVRQSENSCILKNASYIRDKIVNSMFFDGLPKLLHNNKEVIRLSGEYLAEEISDAYDKYGMENVIVINRSNKRANKYNEGIRNSILYRDSQISVGDYIMTVKNNYFWTEKIKDLDFIANGDIAKIIKIYSYQDLYGFRFADIRILLIDYDLELDVKILLDAINSETASLSQEENRRLFNTVMEDYVELGSQKERVKKVKENTYFNALQVKFAYAITCHKAQGGQWSVVFLDQGYITENHINKEYLRWLYTAFTRALNKIYLVNFSSKFFDSE